MRVVLARVLDARVLVACIALYGFPSLATTALAQEVDPATTTDGAAETDEDVEEVVVTGSRLSRDTYTSISPLQVISGQVSREIGLIDAGTILQESSAASGVQIDLTFQGFVLDNGPAASTVDLRGLGPDRTLFLINGRRLSPAGVEGAPSSPDVNLIPASLVQQYEVLLDGASSVYGSDAVAGVVNVILRKDFDGFEVEGYVSNPAGEYSAGQQNTISAAWGHNGDRGFIGIGAEYREFEPVTLADREWTDRCERHYEITDDGEVRHVDQYYSQVLGMEPRDNSDCAVGGLTGYMTELSDSLQLGSLFYRPGFNETSLSDYVDYNAWSTVVDMEDDGYADANFYDRNLNGATQFAQIIPDISTTSALAFGEYTFSGEANITPYFEVLYSQRKSFQNDGAAQLFPQVPGGNPYNPCNPNGLDGVDCGLAYDEMLDDPEYAADFAAVQGLTPAEFRDFGIIDIYSGPLGPIDVQPVVAVRGDRNTTDVTLDQMRLVGGVRGDIPFVDFGTVDNWSFDAYYSFTESDGRSSRLGVRSDRLDYALGWFSSTNTPCVNDDTNLVLPDDMTLNCVPVNMFASSLMRPLIGDFETEAERRYLFDSRDFTTKYEQTIGSAYATGEVFPLPGGEALFGIGAEYRVDEIDSIPDDVAADGLFFGFFSDGGAVGEKNTKEAFAELELPVLAGVSGFEELTANISTRYTDDEFYGGAWTYSGKLAWRPVDSLMLRGTVGTSYRAPNLRENFLLGQTGFLNLTDPCVVPQAAYDPINGYIPENDNRPPEVLANCVANGIDPTTFTNGGNAIYSVEVEGGGSLDLAEEKSDSFSAGLTWEQPFFTAFDFVVSATYYEIDIRDEIIEPSAGFIISDCYYDLEGDSAFCDRITRSGSSTMTLVDQGFINRDEGKARGVDLNMRFDWPTQMFGTAVDLAAELAMNRALELSSKLEGQDGIEEEEYVGEFGFPEWKGRLTLRADVGNWRYTWSTRYISSVAEDPLAVDPFDDVFTGFADTCLGEANGDVNCRNIGYAENYFVHDASVYYYGDAWTVGGGMRNVFDEEPPLVDGVEVFSFNNVPFGAGYDIFGRTLFANVAYHWQ